MAEPQPPAVVEGANTNGEIEDEVQQAKSAEDRKAAAALASMDSRGGDENSSAGGPQVDKDAASKAMKSLASAKASEKKDVKKVKVDPADVTLLMDELDMTKVKSTELLKAHDGDAVAALKAFIAAWDKKF